MKIRENINETPDFAGRCPVCTVKGSELAKIAAWLFQNYEGYKFGIVFDVCGSEYPVPEHPADYTANVLFLDNMFDEVVAYMGAEKALEWLKPKLK